jgi:DNA-binding CsgD family transcriptional regulator
MTTDRLPPRQQRPTDRRRSRLVISRRGAGLAAAAVAAVVGLSVGASVGTARSPRSWLAAGDSYSSGEGLPHATGSCARALPGSGSEDWADVARDRLATALPRLARPRLVACTGARSTDFFSSQWTPTLGRFDLVTFTFGGNDIGFSQILKQCIGIPEGLPSDPGHNCPSDALLRAHIASTLEGPYPSECRGCGREFTDAEKPPKAGAGRHQVAELPPITVAYTEHLTHRLRCPGCKKRTRAKLGVVDESAFGPLLQAAIVTRPAPPVRVNAWVEPPDNSSARPDASDDTPDVPGPDTETLGTGLLTARQLQVVALLADGHRHRSIAACLSISPDHVHRHVRNTIDRLGVRSANETRRRGRGRRPGHCGDPRGPTHGSITPTAVDCRPCEPRP